MSPEVYALDANVFIEASRRYYAFDLVPAFWQCLARFAAKRRIVSVDRVRSELEKGHDELWVWIRDNLHDTFASTDDVDVIQTYKRIMGWAQAQNQFTDAAKAEFAAGADAWLVAYAVAKGCIIVTHESYDKNVRSKVKIPNACAAFAVEYIDTFSMLRRLGGLNGEP